MATRRRLPKLDACKVRPERFRRLSADQLMKVWARLGASRPSRTEVNSLLKGIVGNLAAVKTSESAYKNDPAQRRQAVTMYMGIVRDLEKKLRAEQARSCSIRSTSAEAQRLFDSGRAEEAGAAWRRVRNLKKQRRR